MKQLQENFSGSNTDGSFCLGYFELVPEPLTKKNLKARDIIVFGIISVIFYFYIDNEMLYVLILIASMRRF